MKEKILVEFWIEDDTESCLKVLKNSILKPTHYNGRLFLKEVDVNNLRKRHCELIEGLIQPELRRVNKCKRK